MRRSSLGDWAGALHGVLLHWMLWISWAELISVDVVLELERDRLG